jgi:hypothetical protein
MVNGMLAAHRLILCVAFGIVVLAMSGCREKPVTTYAVTGTVYLDKKPLADADITFIPAAGPIAHGESDAEGKYTMTTIRTGDGVSAGKNMVMVAKFENARHPVPNSNPLKPPSRGRNLIPDIYANTATSGLEFDVVAGQDNKFDIHLLSRPKKPARR